MRTQTHNFILFFLSCIYFHSAKAEVLHVYGWPSAEISHEQPDWHLGNDPILGALSCVPLSRLDLMQRSSTPVVFSSVQEKKLQDQAYEWNFDVDTTLRWWSGENLSVQQVAEFIKTNLAAIVREKSLDLWKLPSFEVKNLGEKKISVRWQKQPIFGAFVLNGVPLWRSVPAKPGAQSLAFECVGTYKFNEDENQLTLEKTTPKSAKTIYEKVVLHSKNLATPSQDKHWLQFNFAAEGIDEKQCTRKVDVPLMSIVQWNGERPLTQSPKFRQIMTQLLPRGEIFRVGSTRMGDLVSGLILRAHPGYNKKVLVRSFDVEKSNQELTQLGYTRPNLLGPRLNSDAKPLRLNIWSPSHSRKQTNLIEKVLVDSFAAAGIITQINGDEKMPDKKTLDGAITGLILDWPEQNYLLDLHSAAKDSPFLWRSMDKDLDQLLESYALSLTKRKPDFSILQRIHQKTYDLEPFSIIMQHSACMRVDDNFGKPLSSVLMRDPEWFKKLIEL